MSAAPKKSKGAGTNNDNFRARRLSVSDIDTSEFDKAANLSPAAPPKQGRVRRMSMSPEMGVVKDKLSLPFPLETVGTYSCHGVEPGMRQGETSAKINQDRGCVCSPFQETSEYFQALFCVYDGHGALGDKVSHFVMNNVQEQLSSHAELEKDPAVALRETFIAVDDKLKKDKSIDAELSGTTAVVVLVRVEKKDKSKMRVWSACCGDSRACLCGGELGNSGKCEWLNLTEDQKPDTPAEMARIKKCGGFVSPPEEEWGGPARVWLDANMTLPGLAMARSIGDHLVSNVGVCAEPVVREWKMELKPPSQGCKEIGKGNNSSEANETGSVPLFIVIASDGVWEFIETKAACTLVHRFLEKAKPDATMAVTKLIETAAAKWRQEEGDYRDDITAIVLMLGKLFDDPPAAE